MSRKYFRSKAATVSLLGVLAIAGSQAGVVASAEAASARPAAAKQSPVAGIEDSAARVLALSLSDAAWRSDLRNAVRNGGDVDLQALTSRAGGQTGQRLATAVEDANRRLRTAKGLAADAGSLLRIRLGDPSMKAALNRATLPWIAAASSDDKTGSITAYDSRGQAHTVNSREVPRQAVYIVDIDVSKSLAKGLEVVNQQLATKGLKAPTPQKASATSAGWWASRITAVQVKDDMEPWFKGDAEMFTLVTGFGLDGKPIVDTVTMPYLNNDGTVYRPNQILVNWSSYKYNLADAVMMEEDGGTNYQALAQALATALLIISDSGAYQPLVDALIAAIPADWWTDDPDFVDSWYTMAKDDNGRHDGAAGNGWMEVSPYFVSEF